MLLYPIFFPQQTFLRHQYPKIDFFLTLEERLAIGSNLQLGRF